MFILLPPSETKAPGGSGAPLRLESLHFAEQFTAIRRTLIEDLLALDDATMAQVLKLSARQRDEVAANRQLLTAATMPAIARYTGVLYDALDAATLTEKQQSRLMVCSALFGLLAATDEIPHYRLSGGTKLPYRDSTDPAPTMKRRWQEAMSQALAELAAADDLIIDMRSGAYQALGGCDDLVTVRVESVQADGSRKVVSHHNKHYKGLAARLLASAKQTPTTLPEAAAIIAADPTLSPEITDDRLLTLIVER
ncbi:peroxide stress protein YaaA [Corynebacterium choanae]|uniref:YaaA family protein n=1 Tax=Corynebacterium choanae TaxID=1862358 RepID=UPI000F4FC49E|nr:peroxide stress protein YaaA [Corynebacterium choanae]